MTALDLMSVVDDRLAPDGDQQQAVAEPGDVQRTCSDIALSTRDLGYLPETPVETGIPKFVAWYREYYGA